jgi:ribose-phosphate pyrophosphokinase
MLPVMMVLGFDDYEKQSRRLAQALNLPCQMIQRHHFPDGESKLTLPSPLPEHVVICRSLDYPNEKLLELLLAAKTARQLGATTLTLVAPYLCYMRQDIAFHPGEAISQPIVGNFLAELFDNVITVDPHLHRIQRLEQAVPTKNAVSLTATLLMAEFLRQRFNDPVILAPDSEAEQWVSAVAKPNQWQYDVCKKIRRGDRHVEIAIPEINLEGRSVIIVDDVASSGQTLAVAAKKCLIKKAKHVDVLVSHALFVSDAKQRLKEAGVRNTWSTDSVSHESNIIPLYELLKAAVLKLT